MPARVSEGLLVPLTLHLWVDPGRAVSVEISTHGCGGYSRLPLIPYPMPSEPLSEVRQVRHSREYIVLGKFVLEYWRG